MDIIINDSLPSVPHRKHWRFCIGSGHAPLALRQDYIEQLKFIHDELGIERVRFHGIFNDDMNVGRTLKEVVRFKEADRYQDISFFQIERVFNNVLSTGMKPFVELGFMPSILASGEQQCPFKYGGNITMPKDLNAWAKFIQNFIKFLNERYGKEEVATWYFEVWNEPNLGTFFSGTQEDYFRLYEATVKAVKSANPDIRIGGPATASNAWIPEFTDYCRRHDVPFDFVSTHQYPGEPITTVMPTWNAAEYKKTTLAKLKKQEKGTVLEGARNVFEDRVENHPVDLDLFRKNAMSEKRVVGEKPLIYTEWNASATCTAPIHDSRKSAAYIAKIAMDLEGIVEGTSFWTFSDIFEELGFFPEPFSGAFGLLNVYGIPKPSFYAFKILSMLGEERLVVPPAIGKTEMACFRKGEDLQILLYRPVFNGRVPSENVHFSIQTERKPTQVSVFRIDDKHCDPVFLWQQMGSPQYLSPEQIQKIKSGSALMEETLPFTYKGGFVKIESAMVDNGMQLIVIKH